MITDDLLPDGLTDAEARRAAAVIHTVAHRLEDPDAVAAVASREDNRDPVYSGSMWGPVTLSNGLPGIALLHNELARTDPRWARSAHRVVQSAAEAMSDWPSRGLYAGPAALLAAVQTSAGRYPTLRRRLAAWVAADQLSRLDAVRPGPGVAWEAYDVVNGLSGTARILIDCLDDPQESLPEVSEAVLATLRHLTRITRPVRADAGARTADVPGWWVSPHLLLTDRDRGDYPGGEFNVGLAHGIPGPLLVLSVALRHGLEVPGQREAVARIAEWLLGWTRVDEWGTYWPCRVSLDDELADPRPEQLFTRTAWCYGAPGVAAALHHAGVTLDVPAWREAAVRALQDALARPEHAWTLSGPTVCHGYAGLLQALHRVGTAEADPVLLAGRTRLARMILAAADDDAPFVFRHLARYPAAMHSPIEFKALDVAGILEGAAGVACSLLSVLPADLLGDTPPRPVTRAWDRVLALS